MAVYVIRLFNQLDFVKQWFARFGADRFESVAEFFLQYLTYLTKFCKI